MKLNKGEGNRMKKGFDFNNIKSVKKIKFDEICEGKNVNYRFSLDKLYSLCRKSKDIMLVTSEVLCIDDNYEEVRIKTFIYITKANTRKRLFLGERTMYLERYNKPLEKLGGINFIDEYNLKFLAYLSLENIKEIYEVDFDWENEMNVPTSSENYNKAFFKKICQKDWQFIEHWSK